MSGTVLGPGNGLNTKTYLHITHILERETNKQYKKNPTYKIYDVSDEGDMEENKAEKFRGRARIWGHQSRSCC